MDKKENEDRCNWCHEVIQVQIFKGSGHCSEDHRKLIKGWKKHMKDLYKPKQRAETVLRKIDTKET